MTHSALCSGGHSRAPLLSDFATEHSRLSRYSVGSCASAPRWKHRWCAVADTRWEAGLLARLREGANGCLEWTAWDTQVQQQVAATVRIADDCLASFPADDLGLIRARLVAGHSYGCMLMADEEGRKGQSIKCDCRHDALAARFGDKA